MAPSPNVDLRCCKERQLVSSRTSLTNTFSPDHHSSTLQSRTGRCVLKDQSSQGSTSQSNCRPLHPPTSSTRLKSLCCLPTRVEALADTSDAPTPLISQLDIPQLYRPIGVDYGSARVGVAVHGNGKNIPLLTLDRRDMERELIPAALLAIALEEGADGFVVGVPLNQGPAAKKGIVQGSAAHAVQQTKLMGQSVRCLAFARTLAHLAGPLGLEVVVVDEHGSTKQARRAGQGKIASYGTIPSVIHTQQAQSKAKSASNQHRLQQQPRPAMSSGSSSGNLRQPPLRRPPSPQADRPASAVAAEGAVGSTHLPNSSRPHAATAAAGVQLATTVNKQNKDAVSAAVILSRYFTCPELARRVDVTAPQLESPESYNSIGTKSKGRGEWAHAAPDPLGRLRAQRQGGGGGGGVEVLSAEEALARAAQGARGAVFGWRQVQATSGKEWEFTNFKGG